jgi:hypothetical protein
MPTVDVATLPSRWRACVRGAVAAVILAAAPAHAQPGRLTVDVAFDTAGTCAVRVDALPGVRGTSPAPFRCDLLGLPAKTGVALTVTVPAGVTVSDTTFPRLTWRPDGAGMRGTSVLPAAPAFVRVVVAGGAGASQGRWLDGLALTATALAVAWSLVYGRRA